MTAASTGILLNLEYLILPQLPKATFTCLTPFLLPHSFTFCLKAKRFPLVPWQLQLGWRLQSHLCLTWHCRPGPCQLMHVPSQLSFQSRRVLNVSDASWAKPGWHQVRTERFSKFQTNKSLFYPLKNILQHGSYETWGILCWD